ncbi:MAG TPA: chemotaxis protein CheW [Microvirga sp.]|jgi:purine-binding chemotaxis protein CheW
MTEAAPAAVAQSFLTVEVGEERFALPADDVVEVVRPSAITRVPLGPASLLGLTNLRGMVIPVVSLHALLGGSGTPSGHGRIVVVDRGAPVGIMIDKVASLAQAGPRDGVAEGTGSTPQRTLDLDALLAKSFGTLARRTRPQHGSAAVRGEGQAFLDEERVTLVCFGVAGQDFALPLAYVREIVAVPDGVAVVPHTESAMLGVVTLRQQLLPLVSLRGLLGLRGDEPMGSRARMVVARIGGGSAALAVDGVKEILRLPKTAIDPVPAILTRGSADAQIQGICRLDGGRRLVSVLSTDHLFKDQSLMAHINSQADTGQDMNMADDIAAASEQFIVFKLGGTEYGLPIGSVEEVVRCPDTLTRLPKAPAFIEGVMNLRGRVVPVIDQRRRFKLDRTGERRRERVVVVRIDQIQAGFVVDTISDVLSIPSDQLRPTPDLATDGSEVIDRIANIEIEGRMILLLNPRELLDRAEKDLLASLGQGAPEPSIS